MDRQVDGIGIGAPNVGGVDGVGGVGVGGVGGVAGGVGGNPPEFRLKETRLGKPMLVTGGYEFVKKFENKSGSIRWRCRNYDSDKCPATCTTEGERFLKRPNHDRHNHEAPLLRAQIDGWRKETVTESVRQVAERPRAIYARRVGQLPEEVAAFAPKLHSLSRDMNRARKAAFGGPEEPANLDFQLPQEFAHLVLHDSGAGQGRFLVLGKQRLLQCLRASRHWICDGTFKYVPGLFNQLWTIHGKGGGRSFPACMFVFMTGKSQQLYERVLRVVKALVSPYQGPDVFLCDFELAVHRAIGIVFPTTHVQGCFFHLCQSLVRQVGNHNLKRSYDQELDFRTDVKCLVSLAFVEPQGVVALYDQLEGHLLNKYQGDGREEDVSNLLNYFRSTYVASNRPAGPPYPPQIWNCRQSALSDEPKTTNSVEGWHNAWRAMFAREHPAMWDAFKKAGQDMDLSIAGLAQANVGRHAPRDKRYEALARDLAHLAGQYDPTANFDQKLVWLRTVAILHSK